MYKRQDNPVTNSINAGCYVFSPEVIDQIPLGKVISVERETFPALVESGRPVFGYKEQSYWLDVGTPAALFKGSRDLIEGEFQAMPGTTIAPSAVITGGTSIGAGSTIAAGVILEDCIIGDGVTIGAGAHLTHCFIAHGTEIAPGTIKRGHYLSKKLDLPISL